MRFSLSSLCSLFILMCCCVTAQTTNIQTPSSPTTSQDVVRIDTELVQTPVMILDAQGRFVNGLTREQFDLRIDGRPVPITFFEEISSQHSARVSEATRPRNMIFFVDDLHLSADTLGSVRSGLLSFVEQMQPGDQVAIVSASGQIGFLQQFTDNIGVLRAAIARLKARPNVVHDTENMAMSEYVAYRIAQGDRAALTFYTNELLRSLQFNYALPKYGGKGAGFRVGSDSDQAERMVMRRAEAMMSQSLPISLTTLAALENFLRASTEPKGRKTVFYLSEGFLSNGRNGELARAMQRVNEAAALSNSVIFSVDARAFTQAQQASLMKTDSLGRMDAFASGESEALHARPKDMAMATGGKMISNAKTVERAVDYGLNESGNYYLLAWRPESEEQRPEKVRNVSVTILGRPELTTRLSAGYTVATPKTSVAAKKSQPVIRRSSSAHLPTRLSVSYLNTPANGNVLTASSEMTIDLGASEAGKAGSIDVAGVVLDDQGKVKSDFQKTLKVQPLAAQSEETNVIYNHRTTLNPGIYQVKVAARHVESERAGVSTQWIEIPDVSQGQFLLSTLLLEGRSSATPATDVPEFQNSVVRRFSRTSRLNFMVFIYNTQRTTNTLPQLAANIRVVQNGRTILTIPPVKVAIENSSDLRRIPFGGSLPLDALPPGKYLLLMTMTDHNANRTIKQHVDFEVE